MTELENRNDIIKLSEKIYLIQAPNGSRFPFCNGFLITDKVTVLIDTGISVEKLKEIDKEKRIDILIITHSHPDHIHGWHVLKDRRILIPKETPESVKDLELMGERFTGTRDKGAYWAKIVGGGLGIQPLRDPDGRFGNGSLLKTGELQIEAIHTPGHTNDHYCFFEKNSGILITADIDFTFFGPWYGNPESDIELFEKSIKKVMALPYKQVCPSHNPPIKGDATSEFNAFLKGFSRQRDAVLATCQTPRTLEQILSLSPFYRNRLPDKILQRIFEEPMIIKNLELLIRDGLVDEKWGTYCLTDKN